MADRNYITTGREAGSNSLHGECFSASYPARSQAHLVAVWWKDDTVAATVRRTAVPGEAKQAEPGVSGRAGWLLVRTG
jgi:hypothetical protein